MIILKKLNKRFKETEICEDVNFKFRERGLTCFFGPSGSGKTTIFNLIAGFDRTYDGEILVNDINIGKLSGEEVFKYRLNNIGFVFQNYNLLNGYTALENVMMGIHLHDELSNEEKSKKALDLLNSLGLKDKINEKVETLSGGQKQRIAIARALINNPKIILADEPTGALDSESTKNIMEILKEISKNKQVIMISHDEEVLEYADEVIELEDKKIKVKKKTKEEFLVGNENEKAYIKNDPVLKKKIINFISFKNFKIHIFKYILAAIVIAFGAAAFVASLGVKDITNKVKNDFKEKNFFYNIGNAPEIYDGKEVNKDIEKVYKELQNIDGIEDIYYQYDLENIKIKNKDGTVNIELKIPSNIAKETMAYGSMPKDGEREIAISSNIANRLAKDIKSLIGKEITLEYKGKDNKIKEEVLKVSGLTNSKYQDFILSSDIEKDIYKNSELLEKSGVSFKINDFEKIQTVSKSIKDAGIGAFTREKEVESFNKSFMSLLKLYTVLSYIILIVGTVISGVILFKIIIERYSEVAVLGALGYTKKNVRKIMFKESIYFSILSTSMAFIFLGVLNLVYKMQFGYGIDINLTKVEILIFINIGLTLGLSKFINNKLIKTEIAEALKK